jgi:hypothetical protein
MKNYLSVSDWHVGVGKAYDDDGISMDYQSALYAFYTCAYSRTQSSITVSLSVKGTFPGLLPFLIFVHIEF